MDGRTWRTLALLLLLAAIGTAIYGVSTGQVQFALLLIFPVFYGSGALTLLVVLLLLGAFASWTAGAFSDARRAALEHAAGRPEWAPRDEEVWVERSHRDAAQDATATETKRSSKWGGVVLLGPIPIAFGNDRRMLAVLMGLALLLVLAVLVLSLLGARS